MLIATQGKSVTATQQYFDTVLTQGDYYLGQEINGTWQGLGTDELGLKRGADVAKKQFNALLRGEHPETGASLTQRSRADRRPGMDLTFSVPKSVSLAWAINNDERIIDVLRATVHETMTKDIEPLMQRRVRNGVNASTRRRTGTGKMIYADFLHKTSRPVDGAPDPHLHVHAFVINWTHQNGKHFAAEMGEVVRQRPSLQAKFEARLARRLEQDLGYGVERVSYLQSSKVKQGWEIAGIRRQTIEKFSQRTEQVEQHARENGVTDASQKGKLGAKTREKKDKGTTVDQLRTEWRSRLTQTERDAFDKLTNRTDRGESLSEPERATKALKFAIEHHLYRSSTVERHQVIGTALEQGVTLTPELVERTLDASEVIQRSRDVEGAKRSYVTTRAVLAAEKQMIEFARDGKGTRKSIAKSEHKFSRDWLNEQQRAAVDHVLFSRDTVTAITGGAGTGKSSLMEEAAEAIRGNGKAVFTYAPSTGAREVLQENGFANAQTVEYLLRNTEAQAEVRDQVIWVDEAGLLDVRSMRGIFDIAKQQNARVVLSGDTRQHSSPRRGEAMRLLEKESGINIARVEAIQRQKGAYRQAVAMISRGHEVVDERTGKTALVEGFDMLDKMGKIKELPGDDRHAVLADQYIEAEKEGKTSLIISPTHAEANQVTTHIRTQLRDAGQLEKEEHALLQLRSLNLTEAQKSECATYNGREGAVVQFHQNVKGGLKRGERYTIESNENGTVNLRSTDGADTKSLPLTNPDRFEVYHQSELSVSVGDKVRFSLSGTGLDGQRRISNGRLDEVKGFDRAGNPVLKSGITIDRDYGHVDLGYVITSHASQGKDRKLAIAAMGADSLPAITSKQFYVTVSRGREDVAIYVNDKHKVRSAIQRSGEQLSATDLVKPESAVQQQEHSTQRLQDYFHRGRQAIDAFRDRITHWWNEQASDRSIQQPGLNGPAMGFDIGSNFGTSPEPERSR
ncbi:MobF family relaxase [Rhodopirellula europaea]|uniref:MobF family relaxase n=1 Tax=Rhodopirellula europaea TaxID=1263866 RepID=UPI003D29090F